jgi:O-antigen/teichoic acid export membrane protein
VSTAGLVWSVSGMVALLLVPVGLIRMVAYRSGEVDHTRGLRSVAVLALGLGGAALLVFAVTTVWFLVSGDSPL